MGHGTCDVDMVHGACACCMLFAPADRYMGVDAYGAVVPQYGGQPSFDASDAFGTAVKKVICDSVSAARNNPMPYEWEDGVEDEDDEDDEGEDVTSGENLTYDERCAAGVLFVCYLEVTRSVLMVACTVLMC